jgi:hypothetical protein
VARCFIGGLLLLFLWGCVSIVMAIARALLVGNLGAAGWIALIATVPWIGFAVFLWFA